MDRYENWKSRRERAMREGRDEGDWRDEERGGRGERYRDYGEPQYGAYGQSSRWSPPWSESRHEGRFGGEQGGRGGDYYGDRPQYEDYGYESRGRDMPQEWRRDRWERGMEEEDRGWRGSQGRERGLRGMGQRAMRAMRGMGGYDEDRSQRWEADEGSEEWSPYRAGGERERGMRGRGPQQRRSYRGRGPKDYQRSDQRIREDVCDLLTEDHNIDASDIGVKVDKGEVTLEGAVTSRHAKHMAENLADACSGVKDVHNHLRVRRIEREEEGERTNGRQYYQGAAGQQTSR